ncbi:MBL fold metallo-hydrolase [Spirochaetia bacterium 38H-sp]|uniref:MBL fold metallo-hydrolase n=1 Tax=Rarispira pelagica TaxID=3141764 RepID=A0ABU9UEP4_9SPIR
MIIFDKNHWGWIVSLLIILFASLSVWAEEGGFKLRILGSGGPGSTQFRNEPAVLIENGSDFVLVDMGNGTWETLKKLGIKTSDIDAFFFTHHHMDHDQEFIPIFLSSYFGRESSLSAVVGTAGTGELVDFVLSFYKDDLLYRLSSIKKQRIEEISRPEVREVHGGEEFSLLSFTIKTAAVNHTIETVAYRFEANGKTLVISGDLYYSPGLVQLAKDADILVLDAGGILSTANNSKKNYQSNKNKKLKSPESKVRSHSTSEEIVRMVEESTPKLVVLTHLPDRKVELEDIKLLFPESVRNNIMLAEDMLELYVGKSKSAY